MPLGAIVLKQNSHSPGLWEVKEFFHKLPFFYFSVESPVSQEMHKGSLK